MISAVIKKRGYLHTSSVCIATNGPLIVAICSEHILARVFLGETPALASRVGVAINPNLAHFRILQNPTKGADITFDANAWK